MKGVPEGIKMAANSKIEWTEATWNPVTGCTKISPGCKHCYAERLARRLQAMGNPSYCNGFDVTLHDHLLKLPSLWKASKSIFVNSMSDLFHEDISPEFILKVFEIMEKCPQHRFQVLTKRSERLVRLRDQLPWANNVWVGVSVEKADLLYRIEDLRQSGARIRFISFEPLLGRIPKFDLSGIAWVIVGGESGPGARVMLRDWVIDIRDQCVDANIPFFFKQWGGTHRLKSGSLLDGHTWDQMPTQIS
jgi:protein gp37